MSARDVIAEVKTFLQFNGERYGERKQTECWLGKESADAILSALESAGYVVVPKEPTEKMYLATLDAWEYEGTAFGQFKREYESMLQAAKEAGE